MKEKQWKPETTAALEKIRNTLYADSDFENAGELAQKMADCFNRKPR